MPKGIYKRIKPVWNKGLKFVQKRKTVKEWREEHKNPCPKCGKLKHLVSSLCRKCANKKNSKKQIGVKNGPYKTRIDKGKPHRSDWNKKVIVGIKRHYDKKGRVSLNNELIRKSIEYRLWREAVFARDNWTCQECKQRGSLKLHPHHIKSFSKYSELRFAIDNGITLCEECHKKTDNYGSKANSHFASCKQANKWRKTN